MVYFDCSFLSALTTSSGAVCIFLVRSVSTDKTHNWRNLSVSIDRRFGALIRISIENRRSTDTEDIGQTATLVRN